MSWCETDAKICAIGETECNVFILGKIIHQKRKNGWWRGRRERIEKGRRVRIEIKRKEQKGTELTI